METTEPWDSMGLAEAQYAAVCAQTHLEHIVIEARRIGASWAAIGEVLGVTRQAAQQRYGGLLGT